MGSFRKHKDCPTSEEILALCDSGLNSETTTQHLASCEFCAAEASLYRVHPPLPENVSVEEIPKPLYELAEALLHGKSDAKPLYRLIESSD